MNNPKKLLPVLTITLITLTLIASVTHALTTHADTHMDEDIATPVKIIRVEPGSLKANVKGNVTLACYDHKTNTIYLDTYYIRHSKYTEDQVLAHEMCHYRQWKENPLRCYLNHLLPYQLRPIEKEAKNYGDSLL